MTEHPHSYDARYARAETDRERRILAAAKAHHDRQGCTCDPKYLTVCRHFVRYLFTQVVP